jgi:hypothetical protein
MMELITELLKTFFEVTNVDSKYVSGLEIWPSILPQVYYIHVKPGYSFARCHYTENEWSILFHGNL